MTSPASRPRHLSSSPFPVRPEPVIEKFDVGDKVAHDTYGFGRVVSIDPGAATVDFGSRTVRIVSPFHKMEKL
jgi:hypothetical protein